LAKLGPKLGQSLGGLPPPPWPTAVAGGLGVGAVDSLPDPPPELSQVSAKTCPSLFPEHQNMHVLLTSVETAMLKESAGTCVFHFDLRALASSGYEIKALGRSGTWIVWFGFPNRSASGPEIVDLCGLNYPRPAQNPFKMVWRFALHNFEWVLDRCRAVYTTKIDDLGSRNRPILKTQQSNFQT